MKLRASFLSGLAAKLLPSTLLALLLFATGARAADPVYDWGYLTGSTGGYGRSDGSVGFARFNFPRSVAIDAAGVIYVADTVNHTIRRIGTDGTVSTLAGVAGQSGYVNATGSAARFNEPWGIVVDGSGNLFVADRYNGAIRKITPADVVTTVADSTGSGAGILATPYALAIDTAGDLYVADPTNHIIAKVTATGTVSVVAGTVGTPGSLDAVGTAATFNGPRGIAVDAAGVLYVADTNNHVVRRIATDGTVTTLAGTAGATGNTNATGAAARFNGPRGICIRGGTLYIGDSANHLLRAITISTGAVTTFAGTAGSSGQQDRFSAQIRFTDPSGVAVDSTGAVFVADAGNHAIRKVVSATEVYTVAGRQRAAGNWTDVGNTARLNTPIGLAIDAAGVLYEVDRNSHTIRKITPAGETSLFLGTAGSTGSTDSYGANARFNGPRDIATDGAGNLYIADTDNHTIRKVTALSSNGSVTTLAGTALSSGTTDATGSAARFNGPRGVAADSAGNVYVADTANHTIRLITSAGVVTTLAGTAGTPGTADGTGTAASFSSPNGLIHDGAGNLYVADLGNHTIRKIVVASGAVSTVAGTAGTSGSLDGTGTAALFNSPVDVLLDLAGNLLVSDAGNFTIRRITPAGVVTTIGGTARYAGCDLGVGTAATFSSPNGLAMNRAGLLYVADGLSHAIRLGRPTDMAAITVTTHPTDQTVAVGASATFTAAVSGPGTLTYRWQRSLGAAWADLADSTDYQGATFSGTGTASLQIAGVVASNDQSRFRCVVTSPTDRVTTFAAVLAIADAPARVWGWSHYAGSTGGAGYADGTGTAARFSRPRAIAIDATDNVWVADTDNHTIRRMTPAGDVTTVYGTASTPGATNASGTAARFRSPSALDFDADGNLYVADTDNHTIRKITPAGVVTTLAGTAGQTGSIDATGAAARFNTPTGVAVDAAGNIYVADRGNFTIRLITPAGEVTTLAGTAGQAGTSDGTGAAARFQNLQRLSIDASGVLCVADHPSIRRITAAGEVTTLATFTGTEPGDVIADGAGGYLVANSGNHTVAVLTSTGAQSAVLGAAGTFGTANGSATVARFNRPSGLAADSHGYIYVADTGNHAIRRIAPDRSVVTLAGANAEAGYATNSDGAKARFNNPYGIAVNAAGNVYVTDAANKVVRIATSYWSFTTAAGSQGQSNHVDSSEAGTGGLFSNPFGITTGADGSLYVSDNWSACVRRVWGSNNRITTLAGYKWLYGTADGAGPDARFGGPAGMAVDRFGAIYTADFNGHTIRKVTLSGIVTTFAGTPGVPGSADGTGTAASFQYPYGIAIDAEGTLYVADTGNHTIRKITPAGVVTTIAGTAGTAGYADGPGTAALFRRPYGIAVDDAGIVYVADTDNFAARRIDRAGVVTTIGGTAGYAGASDGATTAARFNRPYGIAAFGSTLYITEADELYATDTSVRGNHAIRQGSFVVPVSITTQPASQTANINTGSSSVFTVTAAGSQVSYQWQKLAAGSTTWINVVNNVAGETTYSGMTSASLVIRHALGMNGDQFRCIVTNPAGILVTDPATLTVLDPPLFTTQPADAVAVVGSTVTFTAAADGTPAPAYQWMRLSAGGTAWTDLTDSGAYSGTTTTTLTVSSITAAMSDDQFRCRASNGSLPDGLSAIATLCAPLSPAAFTIGFDGGTYPIAYRVNAPWAAAGVPAWITLSHAAGDGQTVIEVVVAANATASARSATFTIGGLAHTITQQANGTPQGELFVTGDNTYGQLGLPTTNPLVFVQVGTGAKAVSASKGRSSLTVKNDGTLWGSGLNTLGGLNDGTTADRALPVQVSTDVIAAAAGVYHTLFLRSNGTLWAVGSNSSGQLGDGTTTNRPSPVQIASDVKAIAAGEAHSLFLTNDGTLWAMGYNGGGQLGDTTTTNRPTPVPVATDVASVAAGNHYSLFVKTNGSLWAMGSNSSYQLGLTGSSAYTTPTQVTTGVASAAGGYDHSLFVKTDGSLWVMGSNEYGRLGDGTTNTAYTPKQIATGVAAAAAGYYHSMFVKTDGTLWATGGNHFGQFGDGSTTSRTSPVQVATGVASVSIGLSHSLIVKTDGSWWVAGSNEFGQHGTGWMKQRTTPIAVASAVTQVATGSYHSLYVTADGTLWATGTNTYGQLGDHSTTNRPQPVPVATGVAAAAAGDQFSLFLRTDGSLWSTGYNQYGQLGDGSTTSRTSPAPVATGVTAIAAGSYHSLFLKTDASLWAVGQNGSGQLGDGSTTNRTSPVQVATGVAAIAAGANHSLFLKTDGSLWAMGNNSSYELGDGTATQRTSPVQVATGISAIAAGSSSSLFVKTDGTLWTTGYTNTQVSTNVLSVAAGGSHTLFTKTDGTLWAMGYNSSGQLGDGSTTQQTTPVQIATKVVAIAAGRNHSLYIRDARPSLPPVITTQPVDRSVTVGGGTSFSVVATGDTVTYRWQRLPAGAAVWADLSENTTYTGTTTPTLTLTTTTLGMGQDQYRCVLTSNGVRSSATRGALLTVLPLPPVVTSPATASGAVGMPFSYTIAADNIPTRFTAGGLPYGLVVNTATGEIAGAAVAPGTYTVTVGAINAGGTGSGQFTLTIGDGIGLSSTSLEIGAGGGVQQIAVIASGVWTVQESLPWIALTASGGVGYANLEILVEPNTTGALRTGTVTIGGVAFTVTQHPAAAGHRDLWGFGAASSGQLATAQIPLRVEPVAVATGGASVDLGATHTLLVKTDGSLWATGDNSYGQLGDGTTTVRDEFTLVATAVANASAGSYHSLFVKTDGSLWAMGSNTAGQIGDSTTIQRATPVPITTGVRSASAGTNHSLFVKTDGSLWAMGFNYYGQLGDGTQNTRTAPVPIATDVLLASAGDTYSLFLKTNGTLWAMGLNTSGQLADGTTTQRLSPVQVATGIRAVAAGIGRTCFIKDDGTVWMTQGGGGTAQTYQVASDASDVSVGSSAFLVRKTDGTLWGTGNIWGELGTGTTIYSNALQLIASGVSAATGATNSTVYITTDGLVWALGRGTNGQLGDNNNPVRTHPVHMAGDVHSAAAGSAHSYFLTTDNTLWGVGANSFGQLGSLVQSYQTRPSPLATAVGSVAAGAYHGLFVRTDGTLWAVGYNANGQLGTGNTTNQFIPVQIATGVASAATGASHSLFVKTDGTLWAMGSNSSYQLGDGTNTQHTTPVQVATGVRAVAAGANHSVFLKTDGTLLAMGSNSAGQLGDTTTATRSTPVQVASDVQTIAAGNAHTVFLKTDGTVWAMGNNAAGQLGDGTTTNRSTPVPVGGGTAATAVAAGASHTLFVTSDGRLWTVGRNNSGQLGDGTLTDRSVPLAVASGVVSVNAGDSHSLMVTVDGGPLFLGAPILLSQPADAAVASGATATFSLLAQSTPAPTYLWQRLPAGSATWADLPEGAPYTGTTGNVLTVTNAANAMNGDQFRCLVSNGETTTSRAATLTITGTPPANYAAWRATAFGADAANDAIAGPAADPDRAGLTNYARYAFNLAARGPVAAPVKLGTTGSGSARVLTLTFNRRAVATDVTYIVESSPNLITWTPVAGLTYGPGADSVVAQDSVALGTVGTPRRFLRVRVTAP